MKFRRKVAVLWMCFTTLVRWVDSAGTGFKPYFEAGINVVLQVQENTAAGTVVTTINAKDTENDPVTFGLDNTGKELFDLETVDSNTVKLKLKAKLNRELMTSYEFQVTITDDPNDPARLTRKDFYLTVLDVNDNAPVFTEQPYRTSVAENTTINTVLITIKAVDADASANGAVVYSFSNDSLGSDIKLITLWQTDKFSIDNLNGKIKLTSSLDFEKTSRYVISVLAEDSGSPKQKSETTVVIDVTDISDMPPKFEQSIYITEINENIPLNSTVITVVARDGDTGVNNPIQYEIYQGNDAGSFAINANTGVITVNGSIDAEKIQSYKLYIRASEVPDPSSNTAVKVLITVIDKNDNPPVLSKNSYSFEVREDLAKFGRIVTDQLVVTDADKNPDYRRYTFHLTGVDSSRFSINPNSGLLTINSTLDYETQVNYTFTIEVTETGTVEKYSDNATVYVQLINANDNTPTFQKPTYNFTFDEEISTGISIAVITATDADLGTFGKITYELKGDDASFFQVGLDTGNITAAKTLDYETKSFYTFVLHAKDGGGIDYKETIATVNVQLQDINDNDPIFSSSSYSKTISENLPAGTTVIDITATDKDSGDNGRVTFSIISGNIGTAFAINGTGFVTTTKPLDREVTAKYTITIQASDHGSPARNKTVILEVNVGDENDNVPVIEWGSYNVVNISEDAGGGTVIFTSIKATDIDEGANSVLIYSMSGGDGRFTLNSDTGKLQLSPTGLDREVQSSYDLVINVTDRGSPPLFNTTTVHVNILDINDNVPEFVPSPSQSPLSYIVTVNEGPATINSTILNINATDKDASVNGEIRFSLSGDEHSFFSLDPVTGVLIAVKELDRESSLMSKDTSGKGRFYLDITATDQAQPIAQRKSTTVRVTIYVEDLNDNSPKFASNSFSARISEATLTGSNVIQVSAEDKDWDYKGKVKYNITAGDPNGNFEITPNGYIAVKKHLDAEVVALYNLTITASDEGTPPRTSQTHVVIDIDDVNDNDPVFNQSTYRTTLKENVAKGTSVVTVFATDSDKGVNGKVIYTISSGNINNAFEINNNTGVIYTAGDIDREAIQEFKLTIQAEDQGVPSSRKDFAEVVITVDDVNDNSPLFLEVLYVGEITENSPPGTLLDMKTAIKASDKDVGNNAKLYFSLSGPGSDNFIINATTAIIITSTASSLDREKNDTYSLTITVTDGGGLNKSVSLTVTITDVNDESPRFANQIYYANVSESATRGTVVRRVTAYDNDLGINKQIIYTSNGADAKFYIDRTTGNIIVDSNLDSEFKNKYNLNVTAANIIGNVPDGYAVVIITVTDVIDSAPYFLTKTITVSIPENAAIGSNVTKVTAHDKDVGDTLIYDIVGGDVYGQFDINNVTGDITTVNKLDRENMTKYTLVVKAKDSIGKSDTVNVVVDVTDYNDNAPVFTSLGFTVDYREQSPQGTSVLRVSATDADDGVNAEITYSIVENITEYVVIDPTTGIVTQGPMELDRELKDFFNFTVKATDKGNPPKSSTAQVSVVLVDINDNNPKFDEFDNKTYYGYVKENQPKGTQVIVINGTDGDIGTNAQLLYGLSGSFDFQIDSNTGNVTTREVLNREVMDKYTLKVRAVDGAIRAREGSTTLIVTVLDDNDHYPVFTKANYLFDVMENVAIGHTVGKITATDKDIDKNAQLSYFIIAGNYNNAFAINETTGDITTASTLDRETNSSFTLTVTAQDHGVPPKQSNTTVPITIQDYNDNPPVFLHHTYNATLKESTRAGTKVTTVSATDADVSINSQFTYKIQHGDNNNVFTLDENTGVMKLKGKLDHETTPLFNMTIWAKDRGHPSLTGYALVIVRITDVDDNAPVFTHDKYAFTVYENITEGAFVAQVNATDIDTSVDHNVIHYGIESGNGDNTFSIGELNGTVALQCGSGCLDRETKSEYKLTISATSFVNNTAQKSTVELTITVHDVNDVAPVFVSPNNKVISEDIQPFNPAADNVIFTVSARDGDVGSNAELVYTIVQGNEQGCFALNNKTGDLSKTKKLDREKKSSYSLVIKATDKGDPPLSTNTTLRVTLNDVNDNHPKFTNTQSEEYRVMENITIGTFISQINATDDDEGVNSVVEYVIISGDNDGAFQLNKTSGELKTAKALDHETTPIYQLIIQAKDKGIPVLTTQKTIKIIVADLNDNKPTFKEKTATLTVAENAVAGTYVGKIYASDLDTTDNIYFYIAETSAREYFYINETSGDLWTKKVLDREDKSSYTFTVIASNVKLDPSTLTQDNSVKRRRRAVGGQSTQKVVINIGDQNDNGPVFKRRVYSGGVSDDIKHGTKALQVIAYDADSGNNSRIAYFIDTDRFSIEKATGWIKAASSFAGEHGKEYIFTVTAKDNFGEKPYYSDNATVKIYILVDKERALLISQRSPDEVRANKDLFKLMLENITGYIINIDDINYKQNEDGDYDYTKTAVLFHAIDPTTKKIVSRNELIKKIDENYLKQKAFFQEWKIVEVKEYVAPEKKPGFSLELALAIGFGVLVVLIILIFCCVILLLRKRQKRKLRAATAASYGCSTHVSRRSSMSTLPNTNMHNAEGSNPVWVDPYQNWGVTDDNESDFQTFKTNGDLSNGGNFYGDIKFKPNTNNPLFESRETYMNIDFDNNESPDVDLSTLDHMSLSRKSSGEHTPSPEPYESSPPTSERNYQYNDNDKYQVTSI